MSSIVSSTAVVKIAIVKAKLIVLRDRGLLITRLQCLNTGDIQWLFKSHKATERKRVSVDTKLQDLAEVDKKVK